MIKSLLIECLGIMNIYFLRKIKCILGDVYWKYDFLLGINIFIL